MATISRAVNQLPMTSVRAVFAYGSGVFKQGKDVDLRKNLLDLVVVVDDPIAWHKENLRRHPHHYSFLKYAGAGNIATYQKKFGAHVYYNTLLELAGRPAKYGVVDMEDLCHDLETWDHLYLSGRLHKPVKFILEPDHTCARLNEALERNLHCAVGAALLQLPEKFTARDLYEVIAGLSYHGDIRMAVGGENKNKIANIVENNIEEFHSLYRPILCQWFGDDDEMDFEEMTQDLQRSTRFKLLKTLPSGVNTAMLEYKHSSMDLGLLHADLSGDRLDCAHFVSAGLRLLVEKSSRRQSTMAIFAAGFRKSIEYALRKRKKHDASVQ